MTFEVHNWFNEMGTALIKEVDRLWPGEDDSSFRVTNLCEEAGEVARAITKRRHAMNAADGLCKGKTVDQWSQELAIELTQLLGNVLDIAIRENIDLVCGTEQMVGVLQAREKGT
jgi:NTP pyrophosphatase (non-canonical NTP hydrolase)